MKLTKAQEEALLILLDKGALHTETGPESRGDRSGVRAGTLYVLEEKFLVRGRSDRAFLYQTITWRLTTKGTLEAEKMQARPKEVRTPAQIWSGLTDNMKDWLLIQMVPTSSFHVEHGGGGLYFKETGPWYEVSEGSVRTALDKRGLVETKYAGRYDTDDDSLYDNVIITKLNDLGREVADYGKAQDQEREENPALAPLTDPGAVSRLKF